MDFRWIMRSLYPFYGQSHVLFEKGVAVQCIRFFYHKIIYNVHSCKLCLSTGSLFQDYNIDSDRASEKHKTIVFMYKNLFSLLSLYTMLNVNQRLRILKA